MFYTYIRTLGHTECTELQGRLQMLFHLSKSIIVLFRLLGRNPAVFVCVSVHWYTETLSHAIISL